jgi:hypothetical protein
MVALARCVDVVPFAEEDSQLAGMLQVEEA